MRLMIPNREISRAIPCMIWNTACLLYTSDYEQENRSVEEKIEKAMADFDFSGTGYCYDTQPGRILYFYFNPEQYFKYIRPVKKI